MDVELGHRSESGELVAQQAVLGMKRIEGVNDPIERSILVSAPRALALNEVTQQVLQGAA